MRKTLVVASMLLVLGAAGAASRDEQTPEGRAYFSVSFGGERVAPRNFHYGLRLDHDSRFVDVNEAPPVMQFDFTRRGLSDARVNGLSVLKRQYRMRQDDEAAAEPAEGEAAPEGGEEPGFFESIGNWFGGLFGGDEEEPAEETAQAEEAPAEAEAEEAPEDLAEGTFMGYSAIDWSMLAVGALGVGFIGSEVAGGDEDVDVKDSDGDGIPDNQEPPPPAPCTPGIPVICPPAFPTHHGAFGSERDPDYEEWLDGGTGQMGDLGG